MENGQFSSAKGITFKLSTTFAGKHSDKKIEQCMQSEDLQPQQINN